MSKTFKKILTMFLVLVMLFSASALTISAATESSPLDSSSGSENGKTENSQGTGEEQSPSGELKTGWCDVKYENGEITVTLTPDKEALLGVSKEQLKDLLQIVAEAIKEVVVDNLLSDFGGADIITGGISQDDLWKTALDAYLNKEFDGEDDKRMAFVKDLLNAENSVARIESFTDYACTLIRAALIAKPELQSSLPKVDEVDEWIEELINDYLYDFIDTYIEGIVNDYIAELQNPAGGATSGSSSTIEGYTNKIIEDTVTRYLEKLANPLGYSEKPMDEYLFPYIKTEVDEMVDDAITRYVQKLADPTGYTAEAMDEYLFTYIESEVDNIITDAVSRCIANLAGSPSYVEKSMDSYVFSYIKSEITDIVEESVSTYLANLADPANNPLGTVDSYLLPYIDAEINNIAEQEFEKYIESKINGTTDDSIFGDSDVVENVVNDFIKERINAYVDNKVNHVVPSDGDLEALFYDYIESYIATTITDVKAAFIANKRGLATSEQLTLLSKFESDINTVVSNYVKDLIDDYADYKLGDSSVEPMFFDRIESEAKALIEDIVSDYCDYKLGNTAVVPDFYNRIEEQAKAMVKDLVDDYADYKLGNTTVKPDFYERIEEQAKAMIKDLVDDYADYKLGKTTVKPDFYERIEEQATLIIASLVSDYADYKLGKTTVEPDFFATIEKQALITIENLVSDYADYKLGKTTVEPDFFATIEKQALAMIEGLVSDYADYKLGNTTVAPDFYETIEKQAKQTIKDLIGDYRSYKLGNSAVAPKFYERIEDEAKKQIIAHVVAEGYTVEDATEAYENGLVPTEMFEEALANLDVDAIANEAIDNFSAADFAQLDAAEIAKDALASFTEADFAQLDAAEIAEDALASFTEADFAQLDAEEIAEDALASFTAADFNALDAAEIANKALANFTRADFDALNAEEIASKALASFTRADFEKLDVNDIAQKAIATFTADDYAQALNNYTVEEIIDLVIEIEFSHGQDKTAQLEKILDGISLDDVIAALDPADVDAILENINLGTALKDAIKDFDANQRDEIIGLLSKVNATTGKTKLEEVMNSSFAKLYADGKLDAITDDILEMLNEQDAVTGETELEKIISRTFAKLNANGELDDITADILATLKEVDAQTGETELDSIISDTFEKLYAEGKLSEITSDILAVLNEIDSKTGETMLKGLIRKAIKSFADEDKNAAEGEESKLDKLTGEIIGYAQDLFKEFWESGGETGNTDINVDDFNEIISEYLGFEATIAGINQTMKNTATTFAEKYTKTLNEVNALDGTAQRLAEIVKFVNDVKIDGETVFGYSENGIVFKTEAILDIIKQLPTMSEIATMEGEDMQLSYLFYVDTEFGDCEFRLTAKLGGGYDEVNKVAKIVSEHFDLYRDANGKIYVNVRVPDEFAKLILKVANSGRVPDSLKQKVFIAISKNPGDVHAFINDISFADLMELLDYVDEKVDFDGIIDEHVVSRFESLDGLSYAQIKAKIAEYEGYYAKAMSIVNRGYSFLEAYFGERFTELTIFDLYDGYGQYGAEFSASASHTFDIVEYAYKALKKVTDANKAEKIADFMAAMLDQTEYTLSVSAKISFLNIGRITYKINDKIVHRDGFLPKGADIKFFAGTNEYDGYYIEKWVDENGVEYTKMPAGDIVLYAVLRTVDVDITATDAATGEAITSKEYDGKAIVLTASLKQNNPSAILTYQWYKDGEIIVGATASTINVTNVSESGAYSCKIVSSVSGFETEGVSGEVRVEIYSYVVDINNVGIAWNGSGFTYGDANIGVSLNENTIPAYLVLDGAAYGDLTATNAGSYTAYAKFAIKDANPNYTFSNGNAISEYVWSVAPKYFGASDVIFERESANTVYEYGFEHKINSYLTDAVPAGVLAIEPYGNENSATNAGTYVAMAKVTLTDTSGNYAWSGSTDIVTYTWSISKQDIDISSPDYKWVAYKENALDVAIEEFDFTYDGVGVYLRIAGLPDDIASVIEYNDAYSVNATVKAPMLRALLSSSGSLTASARIDTEHEDFGLVSSNYNIATEIDSQTGEETFKMPEDKTWSIKQRNVTDSETAWDSTQAKIEFNGSAQNVILGGVPADTSGAIEYTYYTLDENGNILEKLDAAPTRVGKYRVFVTVKSQDSQNYVIPADFTSSFDFEIAPQKISVSVSSDYAGPYTYSASPYKVTLSGLEELWEYVDAGIIKVEYDASLLERTNAGTTNIVVKVSIVGAENEHNYRINGDSLEYTYTTVFVINPLAVTAPTVELKAPAAPYVYDGNDKTVSLEFAELDENLPADLFKITVTSGLLTAKNAATYTVEYTVSLDDKYTANYSFDSVTGSKEWSIAKAKLEIPASVAWNYTSAFKYDGVTEYSVALTGLESILDKINVVYTNEKNTAIGIYDAKAVVSLKTENDIATNYELSGTAVLSDGTAVYNLQWQIAAVIITLGELNWITVDPYTYDGTEKTVYPTLDLSNIDAETLAKIKVEYSGDVKGTNAKTYTVTVTITPVDPTASLNFTLASTSCEWVIRKATYDMSGISFGNATVTYDGTAKSIFIMGTLHPDITVTYEGNGVTEVGVHTVTAKFVGDSENYEPIPDMTATITINEKASQPQKDHSFGDIVFVTAENGLGEEYVINVIDLTENYKNLDLSALVGEGKIATLGKAYDIHFLVEGAESAVSDSFTVKLLIPENLRAEGKVLKVIHIKDDGTIEPIDDSLVTRDGNYIVFQTTHFSVYAIVEVTDDKSGEDPAPTPDPGDDDEESFAWLWIRLAILAVLIAAIIVVIIFVKKRRDEEPEPTETVETPVAPTEEPEAKEEPAVEEEPVAEPEPIAEPEPVAEPAPAPVVIPTPVGDDDEMSGKRRVNGQIVPVRFRTSFMSRLIQSEPPIQDYYTEIKNLLLSYKGVKARTSWNFESFNKGRIQCAKLNVKGNAFLVYLGLDPNEYNANKYHFVDVSDKPKLDKVPMMLKIKSDRALKYAVELIEEVMRKNEIEQGEVATTDYHMPYETTDELADRDLVKIILPAGMVIDENTIIERVDVGELLKDMGRDEETVEAHHVNIINHHVAPESIAFTTPEVADEIISDEQVSELVEEIVHTPGTAPKSNKCYEINIDTICENFEDGETVTIEALKAKRLVSKKAERIKVLARGRMTKNLTVIADKYSIQAIKMIGLAGGLAERYKD